MHEVRDVQSACMVTLGGHTPPRWEQRAARWMVPTERRLVPIKHGNANVSDEVRKMVAVGRRPKAVAAVFTSDTFQVPLC